jgi:GTP-binding protein EngB required for normal cell division
MDKEYEKNIKPILNIYDKIRETLRFENIELPKIVVVGDQSSGKSSVLESITGIQLPRGENTVTKCPIVIQMREAKSKEFEHATIRIEGEDDRNLHKINIDDIKVQLELYQEKVLSCGKDEISEVPIYVCIEKVGVPNLTLYDLPGITYKNEKLTTKIRNIINKYCAGKETLILLVIPAIQDFTTSEAISLIRKFPDFQDRTIAIITKIDIAIKTEKNIANKINNNELDLKFKPIVVRNRTQEEIDLNLSSNETREREYQLFQENRNTLMNIPAESLGTAQLVRTLVQQQKIKLLSSKSAIRDQIAGKLYVINDEYRTLPLPSVNPHDKYLRFKECLTKFVKKYQNLTSGTIFNLEEPSSNLCARIKEKFDDFLMYFKDRRAYFLSEEYYQKLKKLTTESLGLTLPNIINAHCINMIIVQEIDRVKPTLYSLLGECKEYLKKILLDLTDYFETYPKLKYQIENYLKDSLEQQSKGVQILIDKLISCESSSVFTSNDYYMDLYDKMIQKITAERTTERTADTITTPQIPTKHGIFGRSANSDISSVSGNAFSTINNVDPLNKKNINESEIVINDCRVKRDELCNNIINAKSKEDSHIVQLMVSTYAYWIVLDRRFNDYYQQLIIMDLVYYYRDRMEIDIETQFSPFARKENEGFIEECELTTKRREELEVSRRNLEHALKMLDGII